MKQTRLKTAALGQTGLDTTRLRFGAWAIGSSGGQRGTRERPRDRTP
jgi:aryl-alcohol dehydrogenase-like predicted oxidoreductase